MCPPGGLPRIQSPLEWAWCVLSIIKSEVLHKAEDGETDKDECEENEEKDVVQYDGLYMLTPSYCGG